MPRPTRASTKKKLRELLEAARIERMAQLREDPTQPLDEGEVTGIYLAAVEGIREQATRRPAMGSKAVFVVGEADRMVSQGANPEAANAFLKLLEEPPTYAYLILTSSRPGALLPTIRSRTNSLRVAPLREDEVADHLRDSQGLARERAEAVARQAEGSIGRALALLAGHGSEAHEHADRLLRTVIRGNDAARLQAAVAFTARGARSQLAAVLDALEARLRDLLCMVSGATEHALDPEGIRDLASESIDPAGVQRSLEILEEAREAAYRNVNPQATVALLLIDLAEALQGRRAESGGRVPANT
jgi:DNA polymerase-3 subunit delta'